jgi:hypothetical protein
MPASLGHLNTISTIAHTITSWCKVVLCPGEYLSLVFLLWRSLIVNKDLEDLDVSRRTPLREAMNCPSLGVFIQFTPMFIRPDSTNPVQVRTNPEIS